MWKIAFPVRSLLQTVSRFKGPTWFGRGIGPAVGGIGVGLRRGTRSRSPVACVSTFPTVRPHDSVGRISHKAIYQALYVQGRRVLCRDLTVCLRMGRALRVPRSRSRGRSKSFVDPKIMISQRPKEAADRAVRQGTGKELSSSDWVVRRLAPRLSVLRDAASLASPGRSRLYAAKNQPALAGHGAQVVRDAIARTI